MWFCTTQIGKQAIFRHLELSLCVDTDTEVLSKLQKFIPDTVLVSPKPTVLKGCICVPSLPVFLAAAKKAVTTTTKKEKTAVAKNAIPPKVKEIQPLEATM